MILVTGANGTVGSEVVRHLVALGAPVRVLVRAPERAQGFDGLDIDVAIGTLDDPETLVPALDGVDHAFLLTSIPANQVEIQGNLVDAAAAAGVEHIVKLSVYHASADSDVEFIRWHRETELQIEASGMGWTHIRPNDFFQNLLFSAESIRDDGVFYAPVGDSLVSSIDVRDVAAVAAAVLTEPGHMGTALELTGPEALTRADLAARLSDVRGAPVEFVDVSAEVAVQGMVDSGLPEFLALDLGRLYESFKTNAHAGVTSTVEDVTGKAARTFDQFATDFAGAFR